MMHRTKQRMGGQEALICICASIQEAEKKTQNRTVSFHHFRQPPPPPLHCSVAGGRLGLLLAAILQAPIDKALGGRALLEVLPGAHHGRVVDQRVEELPVAPGSLGTGHFQMLFLLLDQLDT